MKKLTYPQNVQKESFNYTNTPGLQRKQKAIPSEIWAKRNVLKKLTLQLKFNKNQTQQYKKIRNQIINHTHDQTQPNFFKISDKNQHTNQISSPKNQKSMRKLSVVKAQNIAKYTDNFFASNVFSLNGVKSYCNKSSSFEGNNFIYVRKAIIAQKSEKQIINIQKKKIFSQREKSEGSFEKIHQRSSSFGENSTCLDFEEIKNERDFLKVQSKKLHMNIPQNLFIQLQKQKSDIFMKHPRAQTGQNFTITIQKRRKSQNQTKLQSTRPQSCILKANKRSQFSYSEGWNTKNSAREQQEPFPVFFRF